MPYTRFTEELQDVTEPSDNRPRKAVSLTLQFPRGEQPYRHMRSESTRLRAASMARALPNMRVDMTYSIWLTWRLGVSSRFSATAT